VGAEESKASCAIAAHFSLAAVGVVVAEFVVRSFLSGFYGEESVCTDAAVAVAKGGDSIFVEGYGEIAVVDDDEVISRAVHFVEV
jgi:hypothetical protein